MPKPSLRNILLFAALFQIFPVLNSLWVKSIVTDAKDVGIFGIFLISQVVLFYVVVSWRRKSKAEVFDEREKMIQLKVSNFLLISVLLMTGLSVVLNVLFLSDLKAWQSAGAIVIFTILLEPFADQYYRRQE